MADSRTVPYGPQCRPTLSKVTISSRDRDGTLLVSPPSFDPLSGDPNFPDGITQAFYQVPSSGLSFEERDRALEETTLVIRDCATDMFGYMVSCNFQCPSQIDSPLANVLTCTCGDPFNDKNVLILPKWVILDYFASLWNAKWPHDPADPDSYWGYVLTMGSSEGILHALWSQGTGTERYSFLLHHSIAGGAIRFLYIGHVLLYRKRTVASSVYNG